MSFQSVCLCVCGFVWSLGSIFISISCLQTPILLAQTKRQALACACVKHQLARFDQAMRSLGRERGGEKRKVTLTGVVLAFEEERERESAVPCLQYNRFISVILGSCKLKLFYYKSIMNAQFSSSSDSAVERVPGLLQISQLDEQSDRKRERPQEKTWQCGGKWWTGPLTHTLSSIESNQTSRLSLAYADD